MEYFILLPDITYSIAPLLAAGIGMLGQGLMSLFSNNIGYQKSKGLMNHQFKLNKDMFDYTNEYNLPVHQMERLKQAGLNPNLVYGNGSVAGNVGSSSGVSIANFKGPDVPTSNDFLNYYQLNLDTKIKEKQAAQLDSIAKKNQAEALKISNETMTKAFYQRLNNLKLDGLSYNNDYLSRTLNDRIQQQALETSQMLNQDIIQGFQIDQEKVKVDVVKQQLENLKETNKLTHAQVSKVLAEANLTDKQADLVVQKIDTQKQLTEKAKAEIKNLLIQGKTAKLEYVLKKYLPARSELTKWISDLDQHLKAGDIDDYINSEF